MMNESSVTENSAVEYLDQLAATLAQREQALDPAVCDGPSSGDLLELSDLFSGAREVEQERFLTPNEIWATMNTVADVADKWMDPEADPVSREAWTFLEDCIRVLGQTLEEAAPESGDEWRRWASQRAASHRLARAAWRRERNRASQPLFAIILPGALPTLDAGAHQAPNL